MNNIEQSTAYNDNITDACKNLLKIERLHTQDDIRQRLIKLGYNQINQSTVSRMLSRLNVIKVTDAYGKKIYQLPTEGKSRHTDVSVSTKIEFITHNQSVVVIKTPPGCAQLIARLLDLNPHPEILGAVAGNDMVMVAPKSINRIEDCECVVRLLLGQPNTESIN
ncbi:arginine repressor [Moritella sp. F3]|uniref:arginine repressor n=1 Tax=Moritella sp. F3 TaxID=2718882 RepID=UPI0018E1B91A|nr:ArgR family transcriptional regulator [Moritella sp. F3]GIC78421.1 arginine repressor [Moritella sp. F1]GIC83921.1 arginine repressor [Moritella sp. F3]